MKCRDTTKPYLRSDNIFRFYVNDVQVPWATKFEGYLPPDYTAKSVEGKPWADPPNPKECAFNKNDGGINRISFHGPYTCDEEGRPLNPMGRTGLRGRGTLGRWGPNHAADAIVSKMAGGQLQFVAIERHDTGELAIPGGMIDKGESASAAVIREFIEEALGGTTIEKLTLLWKNGHEIYKGYVDDPRNTDNAWMETTCVNFHDTSGLLDDVQLKAGDDAKTARWTTASKELKLYASHAQLVSLFAKAYGIEL